MERSAFDEIRLDVWKKIKEFYGDRVKGMEFYDIVDEPDMWTFKIGFFAYDYFWVVFRYKLDEIRMSICCGDGISISRAVRTSIRPPSSTISSRMQERRSSSGSLINSLRPKAGATKTETLKT